MMRKLDYIKIVKVAAGAGIAITLAGQMGLKYSTSAGIIALLSIQDTKRETIRVMIRRVSSFLLSVFLSAACFRLVGYNPLAITIFLLPFSAFCILLGMQDGISVNTVLVTHFLAERSMMAADIRNELLLLVIGAGTGVLLNLYIPGKEKQIRKVQREIEELMRRILGSMAERLAGTEPRWETEPYLGQLEEKLAQGEKSAFEDMENQLLSETQYFIRYMNMRKMQSLILERIYRNINYLNSFPSQSAQIAVLMGQISLSFREYNNALGLLAGLYEVKLSMREQQLPKDREEFENRAVLYQILLELEHFLILKKEFVQDLSAKEVKRYWQQPGI